MESNTNSDFQYIEDYYPKLKELYDDDRIIECIDLVTEIEKKIFSGDIEAKNNTNEEITDYEYFRNDEFISQIYDDSHLFNKCWNAYNLIDQREADRSHNGVDTWFKYEEDVNTISIIGRVVVKSHIMKVLAVLAEVDLMNSFIDKFDEAKKISSYSLFRWLVRIRMKMPVTIANRECYLVGFGTVIAGTTSAILPFRSVVDQYYGFKPPEEESDFKRIVINYGFFHIKYIDENSCEVTNCYNVDPKVPVLPIFLLNTFLKELGYYIMNDLRTQVEKAGEIYDERIKENKVFYDKLWNVLQESIIKEK